MPPSQPEPPPGRKPAAMPRRLLGRQCADFAAGVLAIVVPVVLLTGVSHYLMVRTMDRFQHVMDHTVELMVPVMSLRAALLGAAIPAHDYLIHRDPEQRVRMAQSAARVDRLLDEVEARQPAGGEGRALASEARTHWHRARDQALTIVNRATPWPAAEGATAMAELDRRMDRAEAGLDRLFDTAFSNLAQEWGGVRQGNRNQIILSGLLSVLVITLALAVGAAVVRMGRTLKASETHFAHLARHDALTGLENRPEFHRRLEEELERARRFGRPCSLLMLDVDHFKRINDSHGHAAGDEGLRRVAAVLKRQVRQIDRVARYGGEEFAVLLPETDADGALRLAERIRSQVAVHPTPVAEGVEERLTASIGVATFPADAETPADLLRAADLALYAAKRAGRDRVARAKAPAGELGPPVTSGGPGRSPAT